MEHKSWMIEAYETGSRFAGQDWADIACSDDTPPTGSIHALCAMLAAG